MKGAYENPDYLEFTYDAPAAGKYQMQVFHSNEDLAGSHSYNIKIIDKYAVVEVNGESDSPVFQMTEDKDTQRYYFVDCGDHNPATLSEGDKFGNLNSVTDQLYGKDPETGYSWGVLMDEAYGEEETPGEGSFVSSPEDKAVYTNYQKALSNAEADLLDGKNKEDTFRYAHNQSESGISPRYVAYKFELEPAVYSVNVGMSNTWGNAANPTVTLSAEGTEDVSEVYNVSGGRQEKTLTVDLTDAEVNDNGRVELMVKATSSDATIQMTYITISDPRTDEGEYVYLPPYNERALGGDALPDGIYMGKLAEGIDRFIDFRNLKNETDRYFFINTFSDDTFDEKTITLDLKEGTNTIRIYNDNSWNVTYGGTTGTPGTTPLPNYTPNFDKFVITPMALENAEILDEAYLIDVSCSEGGTAYADQNSVSEDGEYNVIMIPEEGLDPTCILVNGEDLTDTAVYDPDAGTYTLHVTGVDRDQDVQVYFAKPDSSKADLEALYNAYKDQEQGDYPDASWTVFQDAMTAAREVLDNPDAEQTEINSAYDALVEAVNNLAANMDLLYFVDSGDYDVTTVSEGDSFGKYNSVTEQVFGEDPVTGKQWGIVDPAGDNTPEEDPDAPGVYTRYTWANQNSDASLADGQPKAVTFRYARGQDYAAELDKISVDYRFELEAGKTYDVEVCVGNHWGNSSGVDVYANSDDADSRTLIAEDVQIASGGTRIVTLDNVPVSADGFLTVNVEKDKISGSTVNVNYIIIREHQDETAATLDKLEIIPPTKTEYEIGDIFSSDGMIVRAVYSDGSSRILTYGSYTVSGFDSSEAGTKYITVSYTEGDITKTAEFEVTVKEDTDKPIETPVNKDNLKAALEAAKEIGPNGYTEESYAALQQAIQKAQEVYDNPDGTQADADNAASELGEALRGLVEDSGNEPGGNEPGGNEPGGNEPGGNEPGGNEPGGNEPGGNEPGGNEPGGNEPSGNEPDGNTPGGTQNDGSNAPDNGTDSQNSGQAAGPKTGDMTNIMPWTLLAIASGAGCVFVVMKRKED